MNEQKPSQRIKNFIKNNTSYIFLFSLFIFIIFVAIPILIKWMFRIGEYFPIINTPFSPNEWLQYYAAFITAAGTIILGIVATRQSKKAYDLQDKQHNQQLRIEETRQRLSVMPVFDCKPRRIKAITSTAKADNLELLYVAIKDELQERDVSVMQTDVYFCIDRVSDSGEGLEDTIDVYLPIDILTQRNEFYRCSFKNTGLEKARVCEISNILKPNNDSRSLGSFAPCEGFEVICAVPKELIAKSPPFALILDYKDVYSNTYRQLFQFYINGKDQNISVHYDEPAYSTPKYPVRL